MSRISSCCPALLYFYPAVCDTGLGNTKLATTVSLLTTSWGILLHWEMLILNLFFFFSVEGEERIIRSCGYLNPEEAGTCVYKAGTHSVFSDYCQCKGDGCNKAGSLQQPLIVQILLPTLLITLLYFFSWKFFLVEILLQYCPCGHSKKC